MWWKWRLRGSGCYGIQSSERAATRSIGHAHAHPKSEKGARFHNAGCSASDPGSAPLATCGNGEPRRGGGPPDRPTANQSPGIRWRNFLLSAIPRRPSARKIVLGWIRPLWGGNSCEERGYSSGHEQQGVLPVLVVSPALQHLDTRSRCAPDNLGWQFGSAGGIHGFIAGSR